MASLFSTVGTAQTAPSYATTSTETPTWMQDAIYNQIQQATNIAQTPYQPYGFQTVAQASPYQNQAYGQISKQQGQWAPALQAAQAGTAAVASSPGGSGAAQPYFNAATNLDAVAAAQPYTQAGLSMNGLTAAAPALNAQQGVLDSLNYEAPVSTLNPYVQQSLQQSGLSAAQPYLSQASQSSAGGIQDFMNPYTQNVMDVMAKQGARNLSENLLPAVSDAFIRSGQFGSTGMGEFGSRAVRDTQEAVLNQQAGIAQQGYGQALGAAQSESARQAQLASTAGQLGTAQQQATMAGGQALASAQQQALGQAQAGASQYGQMAGQIGGLTQAQQAAMLSAGQNIGSLTQGQQQLLASVGQQAGSIAQGDLSQKQSALGQLAAMAQQGQQMGLTDAAALEAAGVSQQAQQQAQLTDAYQQWQQQQAYPKQQLDWLSTQVRGMAPITPSTQTQSGYSTTYGPSGLSQLATGLSAGAAIYNTK